MSRVVILGATGSLGRHVVQQAISARHDVAVVVRTPSKLTAEVRDKVSVHQCDLSSVSIGDLTAMLRGHDAVINTAGLVTEGQVFVNLVDRLVTSLEAISTSDRPACWFLAGAGLLDIDASGRRGVDLPRIGSTYWPHRVNFERIRNSDLDWRLLCPGPMVEQPPLGLDKTPDFAGAIARSSPCLWPRPARRLVPARVRLPRSGDDHLLRRRRCSDARKCDPGRRNFPPQGWRCAAAGHARPKEPMGGPAKESGLTFHGTENRSRPR